MDVVYRLGTAAAADIHVALPDPPTYTAVRGLLRVLVEKGHLRHQQDGKRYVHLPSTPRPAAGASSIAHVVKTFFAGSPADVMAALLGSEWTFSQPGRFTYHCAPHPFMTGAVVVE